MYTKLSVRPQMKISPQLVISGKLLQVPGSELEQFIHKEMASNPALEFSNKSESTKTKLLSTTSGYRSGSKPLTFTGAARHPASSFEELVENIARRPSPLEALAEQIMLTAEKADHEIALSLLHCLDHRGFLVTPIDQLARELGVSNETIARLTRVLHQLEPPGIGARDLRECFLIQCTHLEADGIDCSDVRRILTLAWSDFLAQQWGRVARKIQKPKSVVEEACTFMRLNFDPHPLAIMETPPESAETLHCADIIILRDDHTQPPSYSLALPGEEEFELRMASSFQKMLGADEQGAYGPSLQEKSWLRMHLERAWMLIRGLRQRWETLRRIGEYLIERQRAFLEHGPLQLKPVTRAVLAQELNLHESTISRAVRDKIVQLPNGRFIPLDDFFDASLAAKEAIRLVLKENANGICDRQIAEKLEVDGIVLSRRTVTKYRREINMESSRPPSVAA